MCVIFNELKGRKEGNGSCCKWTQTNSMELPIILEMTRDWYAIFTTITHDMWPTHDKVQYHSRIVRSYSKIWKWIWMWIWIGIHLIGISCAHSPSTYHPSTLQQMEERKNTEHESALYYICKTVIEMTRW